MEYVISSADQLLDIILGGLFDLIFSILLYILLGFILAIVSTVYLVKKKWARRENRFWNFVTYFHYVFIFAAFLTTAPMLGVSRSAHTMANDLVSNYLKPTIAEQINDIQALVIETWPEEIDSLAVSIDEVTESMMSYLRYTPDEDEYFAEEKVQVVSWIVDDLGQQAIAYTLAAMVESGYAINGYETDDIENFDIESDDITLSLSQIQSLDFSHAGDGIASMVERSVNRYIRTYFAFQYFGIFMVFLMILAFPIIEMAIYHGIVKKKKTSLPEERLEKQT